MNFYEVKGIEAWISDLGGFELYQELPMESRMDFQSGQFYEAHVKYPLAAPAKVLELVNYDPEDESQTVFKITKFTKGTQGQTQFPIKSLNLRSDERLYILAGKPRTVIVLGYVESEWLEARKEKLVLCLPIASFKRRHTTEQIISIQLFEIEHLFYIKPVKAGPNLESAARFELIQPIQVGDLQPVKNANGSCFKLSSSGFKLLLNHLTKYLSGGPLDKELDKEISAFRDLMSEELRTSQSR